LLDIFFDRVGETAGNYTDYVIGYRFYQDVSIRDPSSKLTLDAANRAFQSRYRIKSAYLDAARRIAAECGPKYLGVHFRGSDKYLEHPRTAWDKMEVAVEKCLASYNLERMFVATDEAQFLAFMKARFGAQRVSSIDCTFLSANGVPAHFTDGDNLKKGEEAFVTMLVLSQSDLCVRTPSYLSGFSKILNPSLPVVTVSSSKMSAFPENHMR
jgi:hypothetical protein